MSRRMKLLANQVLYKCFFSGFLLIVVHFVIEFVLVDTTVGKPLVVEKSGAVGGKTDVVQMPGLL